MLHISKELKNPREKRPWQWFVPPHTHSQLFIRLLSIIFRSFRLKASFFTEHSWNIKAWICVYNFLSYRFFHAVQPHASYWFIVVIINPMMGFVEHFRSLHCLLYENIQTSPLCHKYEETTFKGKAMKTNYLNDWYFDSYLIRVEFNLYFPFNTKESMTVQKSDGYTQYIVLLLKANCTLAP